MNPIERAGEAIDHAAQEAVTRGGFLAPDTAAELAYEAIDTDQLADVLSTLTTCDGQPHASELHHRQARAVKNWLTGKDTQ